MIRIKKLDHVVLRAQDPERIVEFYCLVLGCTVERRSSPDIGIVQLRVGGHFAFFIIYGQLDSFHVSTPTNWTRTCRVSCDESWHGPVRRCFLMASTITPFSTE